MSVQISNRKNRIRPIYVIAIVVLSLAAIIGLGVYGYFWYQDNVGMPPDNETEALYDDIKDKYVKQPEPMSLPAPAVEEKLPAWANPDFESPSIDVDFDALIEANPDFIGWLHAEQFGISYPAVQEQEIDEYVHLTFYREKSEAGCVFMDVASYRNFDGYSDFLFAHNMRNKTMFGSLKRVQQSDGKEFIDKNPYIYILTPDAILQYRIFSFYRTIAGSPSYDIIETKEEYEALKELIAENTEYPCPEDVSFEDDPEILTLSTCNGSPGSDKRLVIHTVKTGVKPIQRDVSGN